MSKENSIVVYPTSANPPTWGHGDILNRAAKKFGHIYWVAALNPNKDYKIKVSERLELMQAYVNYYKLTNVTVDSCTGTLIRYAESKKADFLLRGLRNTSDFHAEVELSAGNRGINKKIETICMFAKPHFATISSSLIRELAYLDEKIDQYVLPSLAEKIKEIYRR